MVRQASEDRHRAFEVARVVLAHEPSYRLGPLTIEPALRRLRHSDGREEILDPKVMQVLIALLRADGEVLTRADLNFSCWGRVVGDDALNRVLSRLRKTSDGIAKGVFAIETVKRVGFRLVGLPGVSERSSRGHLGIWLLERGRVGFDLAILVVIAIMAAAALWAVQRRPVAPPPPASIAVLPFRALTPTDAGLADGLSEELLSQLARYSDLRVMGRSSSWAFRETRSKATDVGRKLHVANILEGSLRRSGDRVRVNASLVSTVSGEQVWAQGFESSAKDILALQTQIATAVADALNRKLVAGRPFAKSPDGTAYNLYLAALGLIRSREPGRLAAAIALLERAVHLDPSFAAAVSRLGTAKTLASYGEARSPTHSVTLRDALALQHRALKLQPDLAEAHAALAMIEDFQGAEAERSMEIAVRLEPRSAENWFWISILREIKGDYGGSQVALRRAVGLDPLWERAYQTGAETAWWLGRAGEAEAYLRRAERDGPDPYFVRSIRARLQGDLSAAIAESRSALANPPSENDAQASWRLALIFWALGRLDDAMALDGRLRRSVQLAQGSLPSRDEFLIAYPQLSAGWRHDNYPFLLERALLKHNRQDYLVAAYDRYIKSPEQFLRRARSHQAIIEEAPNLALALERAGRHRDAAGLLAAAAATARQDLARGPIPGWYHAACARLSAASGNEAAAVAALERAIKSGWAYWDSAVFSNLADEPAFSRLKSNPRFRAIAQRLRSDVERERREAARL
jgi:TolB-like protein/DNA-binding winged helix-turn-helix (wHTH) protein